MAVRATHPTGDQATLSITRSVTRDMVEVIAKHNPTAPRGLIESAGKAAAALGAAAARLTEHQQSQLVAHRKDLTRLVAAVVEGLETEAPVKGAVALAAVSPDGPVEASQGEGTGPLIDREEGFRRVAAYATPKRLEEWAGPVAGPTELHRDYGINRSTLYDWQRRGAIVGLLKGERKHVFPVDQFIDGRPVQGMTRVMKVIDNPRAAWLWLTRPHPTGDRSAPLARLKGGRVDEVVAAAEGDFG